MALIVKYMSTVTGKCFNRKWFILAVRNMKQAAVDEHTYNDKEIKETITNQG